MAKKVKFNVKNIVSIILAALVLVGVIAGIVAIANPPETKTISSTVFRVGGLNVNGEYIKTKESIYTKDLIECQGLEIEPEFESNVEYQVFYYDYEKDFIRSTDVMTDSYEKDEDMAVYCRVVISPIPEEDEEVKIYFWEVVGIANNLNITVNRKQDLSEMTVSGPVFETITTDYTPKSGDYLVVASNAPFMYTDTTLFSSSRVYRIGVAVGTIKDPTVDNTMTIYVIEKDGEVYKSISEHKLTIAANTYETTDVYEWVYFDCDIEVGKNQTLAFAKSNDTIRWIYTSSGAEKYHAMNKLFTAPGVSAYIYFDIHIERNLADMK